MIPKPGVVMGGANGYSNGQILRDLLLNSGSNMAQTTISFSADCTAGGTQSTTSWYTSNVGVSTAVWAAHTSYAPGSTIGAMASNGHVYIYKANTGGVSGNTQPTFTFTGSIQDGSVVWVAQSTANVLNANALVGATFTAIRQSDGSSLGSGTIAGNTTNWNEGVTLTLNPPLSAPCTVSSNNIQNDTIFVQWKSNPGDLIPADTANVTTNLVFDTTDLPSGTGATQVYSDPTGAGFRLAFDAVEGWFTEESGNQPARIGINMNGSYTLTYYEKCVAANCSIPWSVGRIGVASYASGTDTQADTSWHQVTHVFTANESGSQAVSTAFVNIGGGPGNPAYKAWGVHLVEASAFPGNTTPFRDAVFKELQSLHLNTIRFMNPNMWGIDLPSYLLPDSEVRLANSGSAFGAGIGKVYGIANYSMQDSLQLCYALNITYCYVNLPKILSASDANALHTFLNESCATSGCPGNSNQSWNSMFEAAGLTYIFEMGNEPWNYAAGIEADAAGGIVDGTLLKPFLNAFKSNSDYDSSLEKIALSQQGSGSGNGQFFHNALNGLGCVSLSSTPTNCPDYAVAANYKMTSYNDTTNPILQGGNAEIMYQDSRVYTPNGCGDYETSSSYYFARVYNNTCYGVEMGLYESNTNPQGGNATGVTQQIINQQYDSIGGAFVSLEDLFVLRYDTGFTGPEYLFALTDYGGSGATVGGANVDYNSWNSVTAMPDGPGQVNSQNTAIELPSIIMMRMINQAIGDNLNLLTTTMSNTPVIASYPGTSNDNVPAQSNVVLLRCYSHSDPTFSSISNVCFNADPVNSYTIAMTGAGAPSFSTPVTVSYMGGSVAASLLNNNSVYFQSGVTPPVKDPTPSIITGPSVTIQPDSVLVMTYQLGN